MWKLSMGWVVKLRWPAGSGYFSVSGTEVLLVGIVLPGWYLFFRFCSMQQASLTLQFGSEVGCESKKKRKSFQVSRKQASESFQRGDHLTRKHFSPPFVLLAASQKKKEFYRRDGIG